MDLQHSFTVPAGIDRTWAMVNDLTEIAGCFPGASLGTVDGDTFDGSVKVKLGPISLVYNGTGTFVERDEGVHRAVIEAKGKDKRGNGTASAKVLVTLSGDADSTDVVVVTDLQVTGKPAQFGRGVMQDVSDKLLGQFVGCVSGKLSSASESAGEAEVGAESATDPPEPTAPDPAPAAQPAPAPPPQPEPEPEQLDMLGTIAPVLVKRYGMTAAVGAVMLLIGILIGRARR